MQKILIIAFFMTIFQGCVYKYDKNYSTHTLEHDEQKVFNIAKEIFRHDNTNEFIIDTTWHTLIAAKRDTVYVPFDVKVKETIYKLDSNTTSNDTKFYLTIYTKVGESEKKYLDKTNYLHTLFWNRIEYATGGKEWLSCKKFNAKKYYGSFLCDISPESLRK